MPNERRTNSSSLLISSSAGSGCNVRTNILTINMCTSVSFVGHSGMSEYEYSCERIIRISSSSLTNNSAQMSFNRSIAEWVLLFLVFSVDIHISVSASPSIKTMIFGNGFYVF